MLHLAYLTGDEFDGLTERAKLRFEQGHHLGSRQALAGFLAEFLFKKRWRPLHDFEDQSVDAILQGCHSATLRDGCFPLTLDSARRYFDLPSTTRLRWWAAFLGVLGLSSDTSPLKGSRRTRFRRALGIEPGAISLVSDRRAERLSAAGMSARRAPRQEPASA